MSDRSGPHRTCDVGRLAEAERPVPVELGVDDLDVVARGQHVPIGKAARGQECGHGVVEVRQYHMLKTTPCRSTSRYRTLTGCTKGTGRAMVAESPRSSACE